MSNNDKITSLKQLLKDLYADGSVNDYGDFVIYLDNEMLARIQEAIAD
jgi:hypothetical protein